MGSICFSSARIPHLHRLQPSPSTAFETCSNKAGITGILRCFNCNRRRSVFVFPSTQHKRSYHASFSLGPFAPSILRSGPIQLFPVGLYNHTSSKFASERGPRSFDWVPIHITAWCLLVSCSPLMKSVWAEYLVIATTWYCPVGQIWSTEGRYAACCTDDPYQKCPIPVSCESTSLLVGPGGSYTITCSGTSSQTVCITGLVYESTSGTAAITNVGCWPTWAGGFWVATKAASTSAATG